MSDEQSQATASSSVPLSSIPLLSLSSLGDYQDDDAFGSTGLAPITNRYSARANSDDDDSLDGRMAWAKLQNMGPKLSKKRNSRSTSELFSSQQEDSGPSSKPLRRRRKSRFKRSDSMGSVAGGITSTSTRSILKRSSMADLTSVYKSGNNNSGFYTDRPANRRMSLTRRVSFKGAGSFTDRPTPVETSAGAGSGEGAGGGRKRLASISSLASGGDLGHLMSPLDSSRWGWGGSEGGEKSPRGTTRKGDGMMSVLRSELMKTHRFKFPDRLAVPQTNRELHIRKEKSSEDIILSARKEGKPPLQKRLSMPSLTCKSSSGRSSIGSESDEVFLSTFQRRKLTLLTSLEKMGVQLPKRGRKYSNNEADVLKRAAEAQRHGSLTSRTLLSNFDVNPPKKPPAPAPEKPLDEVTKSKLQFIFDTMTNEDATEWSDARRLQHKHIAGLLKTEEDKQEVTTLPGLVGRHRFSITENEIAGSTVNVFKSRLRRRKVFTSARHKLPPVAEHDGNEAAARPDNQSQGSSAADPRRNDSPADDARIRCLLYAGGDDTHRNLINRDNLLLADKLRTARSKTDDNNNNVPEASPVGDYDASSDDRRGPAENGTQPSRSPLGSKTLTSAASPRGLKKKSRLYSKRGHRSADACTASTGGSVIHKALVATDGKELSSANPDPKRSATTSARRILDFNHFSGTRRRTRLNEKLATLSFKFSSHATSAALGSTTTGRNLPMAVFPALPNTLTSTSTILDDRRGGKSVRVRTSALSSATGGTSRSLPPTDLALTGKGWRSARATDTNSSFVTLTAGGWRGGGYVSRPSRGFSGRNFVTHLGAEAVSGNSVSVRTAARRRRCRRKKKGSTRFKTLAKFICLLLRAWRIHSLAVESILEFHQSVDVTLDTQGSGTLLFDITEYKADKEARLSTEAIRILKKRPKERTSEEIHYVQIALWNYKSLAEYPVHMQRMIAERAWFESYEPKRVIVREGHHPMGFYFVLSGSALVSVMDMNKGVAKTIMYYNRGDSFGELAIMNGSRRQSTVISKDSIQLLVLSDQDFVEVFMSGGLKDPEDPFLNSLSYLDGWPKEKLAEHPKKANYSYFKRSVVLVADSHNNDWIIIVKSGSLNVLKKLKHMDPKKIMAKRAAAAAEKFSDTLMDEAEKQGHVTHEDRVEAGFQHQQEQIENMGHLVRFYALPQIFVDTNESYNEMKRQHDEIFPDTSTKNNSTKVPQNQFTELHGVSMLHARELAATAMSEHQQQLSRNVTSVNLDRESSGTSGLDPKRLSGLIKKGPFMAKSKREGSSSGDATQPTPETRNHTTLSALFGPETPSEQEQQKKPKAAPPAMFVNVQTLTKGMVFGLSDLFFDNPSTSLVSNGAECISISKKLFMEHASHAFITRIREDIYPYPTEEDLQENLESQVMWDYHRRQTVGHVVHDFKWSRADKNDARLNIPSALGY